ncbi:ATP-binding protein [Streptosporangium soli]|nr:ATP-binding protein [Streptosporangium sp. KLBMP 9127]
MPYLLPTSVAEGVEHVPVHTVECFFPGEVTSAGAARRLVRDHLGRDELADDCALIVTELVTNAVLHGGTAVRLTLTAHERRVYAEIADDGAGRPRASVADLDATGGRGLLIVGTLARDWGVVADPDGGKVVWFVLEG